MLEGLKLGMSRGCLGIAERQKQYASSQFISTKRKQRFKADGRDKNRDGICGWSAPSALFIRNLDMRDRGK